jgi:hypothetical protein
MGADEVSRTSVWFHPNLQQTILGHFTEQKPLVHCCIGIRPEFQVNGSLILSFGTGKSHVLVQISNKHMCLPVKS